MAQSLPPTVRPVRAIAVCLAQAGGLNSTGLLPLLTDAVGCSGLLQANDRHTNPKRKRANPRIQ
jgi:hypothetical protein